MNGSPLATCNSMEDSYVTPSRKPTEHHCNADRKPKLCRKINQNELDEVTRSLFCKIEEQSIKNRPVNSAVNIKLLR